MNERTILNQVRLPARLDVGQTAELLGFMEYEIQVLVRFKLLRPLGEPAPNGRKFFSSVEIHSLAENRQWLDKATRMVSRTGT